MSRTAAQTHQWFMVSDRPDLAGCALCGVARRLNVVMLLGHCSVAMMDRQLDKSRPVVIPDKGKPYVDVAQRQGVSGVSDKMDPNVAYEACF